MKLFPSCIGPAPRIVLIFAALGFASSPASAATTLFLDAAAGPIGFAANELSAALASEGRVERRALDLLASDDSETRIVMTLASSPAAAAAVRDGVISAPAALDPEGFSLRIAAPRAGARTIWVLGHDEAGAMYGGMEVAEIARLHGLARVANLDMNPRLAERGLKFNLPLDARTPSYTDASDVAQPNIGTVWEMEVWRELIDRSARSRYNLISLWNLHPFPSMVRVPEYPDIALADVQRSTVKWNEFYPLQGTGLDGAEILGQTETLKRLTIDEKIAFWREVMRYGKSRNVYFYVITWNIFVNGTFGKHGITDAIDNPTTRDYFRHSVRELLLTYPDLAGIGVTAGENMPDATPEQKEDWVFQTYGQGALDAIAASPGRRISFIHRAHETSAADVLQRFATLVDHPSIAFKFSFKYAEAHSLSSVHQPFGRKFLADIGDTPALWTMRNDDNFYFRWGAPEFVRGFIGNMPGKPARGFYFGSNQYIGGREFLSQPLDEPRPLEFAKHWYHYMLWGRMSYDPGLTDERLIGMLHERHPGTDAARLFAAWQDASMVYPLTTGFHWAPLDFQWNIEGCMSRAESARTPHGFHDINRFISLPPHPGTDNISIPRHVAGVRAGKSLPGTTPPQVARQLHERADRALATLESLSAGQDRELWLTMVDIRAMAQLGKYYAHKIEAATELALYRDTHEAQHHTRVAAELNQAAYRWRLYASTALGVYKNPLWSYRIGVMDWRKSYLSVLHDLTSTGSAIAVPSMQATPGGTILEAEAAEANIAPVATETPGFTGAGYRDFNRAQGTQWIEWTYEAPAAGHYMLEIRYTNRRWGMRQDYEGASRLTVNGDEAGGFVFWHTADLGTWVWDRMIVRLPPGRNSIRLHPLAMANIDHLNVIPLFR